MTQRSVSTADSISPPWVESRRTPVLGAETLHRNGHRDDHVAALVLAHDVGALAGHGGYDFRIAAAVLGTELAVDRQIAAIDALHDPVVLAAEEARRRRVRRRQVEAQNLAADIERARVEQQRPVAIVDARARVGRRHQQTQKRRDALGIERELERREHLLAGTVGLAGMELKQPLWIDGDGIGVGGGGSGDGAGDDLALDEQALDARVDQAGAVFGKIQNAGNQRDEAGEIEQDDATGDAREADIGELAAEPAQSIERAPQTAGRTHDRGFFDIRLHGPAAGAAGLPAAAQASLNR